MMPNRWWPAASSPLMSSRVPAALSQATLARDADLACDLLAEHYLRTARFIEAQMAAAPQAQTA